MSITAGQVAQAFDSRYLNLILFPTEQCNFRCTYCYEDFEAGKMPVSVVTGVKALLTSRAPELDLLDVSWFGGEPLIAKDVIYEVSEHAATLATKYPGFTHRGNVTTNGYHLDLATATRLAELGVDFFQISLDGPRHIHDRTRVKATGAGTFARIWSNLLAVRQSAVAVTVMLRVHYSPENYMDLDPLVDDINSTFGGDERFTVHFKAVERLGGPSDESLRIFNAASSEAAKRALIDKLDDEAQAATTPSDAPYICYAARPNSLAVRSNGELAKCTVALYDEANRLGHLNQDGSLTINQSVLRRWMRGFSTLDPEELACPYREMNQAVKSADRGEPLPIYGATSQG